MGVCQVSRLVHHIFAHDANVRGHPLKVHPSAPGRQLFQMSVDGKAQWVVCVISVCGEELEGSEDGDCLMCGRFVAAVGPSLMTESSAPKIVTVRWTFQVVEV